MQPILFKDRKNSLNHHDFFKLSCVNNYIFAIFKGIENEFSDKVIK